MFKVEQTGSAIDQAWGLRESGLSSMTLGFDLHNCKDREVILRTGYGQELTAALGAQEPETEERQEQGAAAEAIGRGWLLGSEDAYTMGLPWWSIGLDYVLPLHGAWIQSLLGGTKIPRAAPCSENFFPKDGYARRVRKVSQYSEGDSHHPHEVTFYQRKGL